MQPLIKRYSPKSSDEIIGQSDAITQLSSFILNYKKQKKKAVLLYGPPGTGKTSSVYALATQHGLEVFEINASDYRNKEQIQNKLGSAINQYSLFRKEKIILVDDIDGLSGTKDRGALPEIIKLMQKSIFPIVMTVQNPYHQKLSSIRQKTTLIEFQPVSSKDVFSLLKEIAKKEKLNFDEDILKSVSRKCAGDLRAALVDMEILSSMKAFSKGAFEELGFREKQDTIINGLLKVFKTTDPKVAIGAFDNVSEDLDQQMLWLDENLPKEYEKPIDLARAYRKLSSADIFKRRIRRWQHWRFLIYINALITAGVAVSKDKRYEKFVSYKPTGRILKMWWAKQKSMKKKAVAEKLAHHTHTSTREAIKSIPYFQLIFKKDKKISGQIAEELNLDKDQVTWLRK